MSCLVTLPSNNIRQWRIRVRFLLQFFEACWELSKSLIELRCLNECIFKKWGKGKRGENDNPFCPWGHYETHISCTNFTNLHQISSNDLDGLTRHISQQKQSREVFYEKGFPQKICKVHVEIYLPEVCKLQTSACNLVKKRLWQKLFPCAFCGIFINTFSYRKPPGTVSVKMMVSLWLC